jgi:hypothetical protein
MTCTHCGAPCEGRRGKRYCDPTCRHAAYNVRRRSGRLARVTRSRPNRTGTRRWLTDPKLPVCQAEGCHFDAGTCGH